MTRDLKPRDTEFDLNESPFLYEALGAEGEFEFEEAPLPFALTPAESPGGGRVTDKRDPARSDVVEVKGVGRKVPLHKLAAAAHAAMVAAARNDGIAAPLLLPVSGYRSKERQAELYAIAKKKHGVADASKWVAPPGHSAHQSGRAIDLYMGSNNSKKHVAEQRATRVYRWLVQNAASFGFYPYEREPWHWEYNPPANGKPLLPSPSLATTPTLSTPVPASRPASAAGVPPLLASDTITGPGVTHYVKIDLGVPSNDAWTGIFVPQGFRSAAKVDVILFLHGFYEKRVDKYWLAKRNHPLPMREELHASGKNVVLVAPTLGPRSQPGKLTKAGALDRFLDQVLKALGTYALGATAPALGQLVLAAHSGGGKVMAGLALGSDSALGQLRECWAFDSFYGSTPIDQWTRWAQQNPQKRLVSHAATDAKDYPGPLTVSARLKKKNLPNVFLNTESNGHYGALQKHWQERLVESAYLAQR